MRLYSEDTVKKIVKDILIELLKDKEYEPMLYTKMCDKIKAYPSENNWHTDMPTEEGEYLVLLNGGINVHDLFKRKNNIHGIYWEKDGDIVNEYWIKACMPIPLFEEGEGR